MSLLFQPEHIDQIKNGEKTATRRTWEGPQVTEGGRYIAATEMFTSHVEAECYVTVTDFRWEPLGDMTEEDAQKEGGYTLEEFRDVWREINGEWDPERVVAVVEFEYTGSELNPDG